MTTHLQSAASKQTASSDVRAEIRELVGAMPIVIFANAIRDALKLPRQQAQRRVAVTVQRAVGR